MMCLQTNMMRCAKSKMNRRLASQNGILHHSIMHESAHYSIMHESAHHSQNKKTPLRMFLSFVLAGETRVEHATDGFGDRCSTIELLPYVLIRIIY